MPLYVKQCVGAADTDLYLQEVVINTSHIQKLANISCLLHLLTLGSNMKPGGGVVPCET
jgi:hypothetical protein